MIGISIGIIISIILIVVSIALSGITDDNSNKTIRITFLTFIIGVMGLFFCMGFLAGKGEF